MDQCGSCVGLTVLVGLGMGAGVNVAADVRLGTAEDMAGPVAAGVTLGAVWK